MTPFRPPVHPPVHAQVDHRKGGPSAGGPSGLERPGLRALMALGALAVIVAGVPALLVTLGLALPVDPPALSPGILNRADDGSLVLLGLLGIAWAAWAVVVLSVALEAWAAVRRIPTPRLPGLGAPQRLAAALVASLALGLSGGGIGAGVAGSGEISATGARADVAGGRASLATLVSAAVVMPGSDGLHASPDSSPREASPDAGLSREELPTVTTQRHDTLWLLAEQYLGDGARFAEIMELNVGGAQPDGRALGADGRVYPGWLLRMPADADLRGDRPARHRVVPGDTLWDIAHDELGDPARYLEVFHANAGDLQPDGRQLEDPDLIRPGWVLEIPGRMSAEPETTADASPAPGLPGATSAEPEDHDPVERPGGMPDLDRAGSGATPSADEPPLKGPGPLDRASDAGDPIGADGEGSESVAPRAPLEEDPEARVSGEAPTAGRGADGRTDGPAGGAPQAAFLAPAGGTLAALLLAGVLRELIRRRRQFQRHRRPGERMPVVGDEARELELLARDAATEDPSELLERALLQLAQSARAAGVEIPSIRTVRTSNTAMHLDLSSDVEPPQPVAPFVAVAERTWRLDPQLLAGVPRKDQAAGREGAGDRDTQGPGEGPGEAAGEAAREGMGEEDVRTDGPAGPLSGQPMDDPADHARPYPGLVTIGVRGDETVLIDVAEAGTVRIEGPDSAIPGVLRALASELALGPAREATGRTLCLSDGAASEAIVAAMEAGELTLDQDPARVAASLSSALRRPLVAPGMADPLEVVLADRPLGVAIPARSGAALITTDPGAPAGAVLALDAQGGGVLMPDGLEVVPQTLGASAVAVLASALAATSVPIDPMPAPDLEPMPAPDLEPMPEPAPDSELRQEQVLADALDAGRAPRILVLGEVLVENAHGRAESTRIGRLAETAAFVLLNPGARPSALQSALWPGRRANPQTCRQMISRTRTWLGRNEEGEPYLMPFADTGGRLGLRPEVGSDWSEFQELAHAGLADPDDVERLGAALALVRGRPFGPVAAREMPWADLHINDMICLITDVAHELAVRHERAGRFHAARDAALRGLLTESDSDVLRAIVVGTRARG